MFDDVLIVVISHCSGELVKVHPGFVFPGTPQTGQFSGVVYLENGTVTFPWYVITCVDLIYHRVIFMETIMIRPNNTAWAGTNSKMLKRNSEILKCKLTLKWNSTPVQLMTWAWVLSPRSSKMNCHRWGQFPPSVTLRLLRGERGVRQTYTCNGVRGFQSHLVEQSKPKKYQPK